MVIMLSKISLSDEQLSSLQNVISELSQSNFITQVYQVEIILTDVECFNFSTSFDAIRFCEKLSSLRLPHHLSVITLTYKVYP